MTYKERSCMGSKKIDRREILQQKIMKSRKEEMMTAIIVIIVTNR